MLRSNQPRTKMAASIHLRLLLLIMVHTLLLPIYGPLIDYHFVEHQPYHDHLYLYPSDNAHIHWADIRHNHIHTHTHPELQGKLLSEDNIVSIPSFDPCNPNSTLITSPFFENNTVITPYQAETCFMRTGEALLPLHKRFIRPSDPPPRFS